MNELIGLSETYAKPQLSEHIFFRLHPLAVVMLLVACLALPEQSATASDTANLTIRVHGIKNNDGKIVLGLHRDAQGFPDSPEKVFSGNIDNQHCEIVIDSLDPGEYAVAVFHDENNNKVLDHGFLGITHKEGIGVSNNRHRLLAPPKFKHAIFSIVQSNVVIDINLKY